MRGLGETQPAVIGGDRRCAYLAQLLQQAGASVVTAALDADGVKRVSLEEALSRTAVLPLPMTRDGEHLAVGDDGERVPLIDIILAAQKDGLLFCGAAPDDFVRAAAQRHVRVRDYCAREELLARNAVLTAEAAVAVAISGSPQALFGSRCLVVGCGRIGKPLARFLSGMGASVTASSRKARDKMWTRINGFKAVETADIKRIAGDFDYIFNTVEAPIFDRETLRGVRSDALIIELASGARGVDIPTAAQLGKSAVYAPGLPGKYAPKAAAQVLFDTLYDMILEENQWVSYR